MHLTLNGEAGFFASMGLREFCGLDGVFFCRFSCPGAEGLMLTKSSVRVSLRPPTGGAIQDSGIRFGNVLHLPNSQNWQDVNPMDRQTLDRVFELYGALRPPRVA